MSPGSSSSDSSSSPLPPPSRSRPSDHPGPPRGVDHQEADAEAIIEAIERAEHPDPDNARYQVSALPPLKLPGFGEPEEDCGEFIVEALRFCDRCGKTHEFKHNCLRYDCELHAPYAIRRRAAGSKDSAGAGPKLDALRKYLNAYRARNQRFHHLVFSIPPEYRLESNRPLERSKQIIREVLDELGVQGIVVYHPFSGDHDDESAIDDRGEWRRRLFHRRDWRDDVREELKYRPHFHVIGVSHFVPGGEAMAEVYDETGWIIERIANDRSNTSLPDDEAMAKALTYCLSHAGIYDTDSGQRRLAAWYKGPDVNRIKTLEQSKEDIRPIVNDVARETLGIEPPDLECDHDVPAELEAAPDLDQEPESGAVSTSTSTGPSSVTDLPRANRTELPRRRHVEGAAGAGSSDRELDDRAGDVPGDVGSSSRPSPTSSTSDDPDRELEPCGGILRHISQAGDYLLSEEWRATAPNVDDLDVAYRSFVDVMTSKGLDPLEDPSPTLPEERPPPEPPPGD